MVLGVCLCWLGFVVSDLYLEWLLAVAFVGGIAAPLNYRWVCLSFQNIRRLFTVWVFFLWAFLILLPRHAY